MRFRTVMDSWVAPAIALVAGHGACSAWHGRQTVAQARPGKPVIRKTESRDEVPREPIARDLARDHHAQAGARRQRFAGSAKARRPARTEAAADRRTWSSSCPTA